jgi:predicted ATPase
MEKNRITKFKINKLFGYQNIEIDFDSKYKIIVGENGLGKTTVLNCLFYVLDKRFKKLNNIAFESIEIIFSDKSKIYFTKNDLEFYIDKSKKHQGSQFYQILKNSLKKDDILILKTVIKDTKLSEQSKRLTVVNMLKKIGVNISAPSHFIYETINKFISESEAINFQQIIETIDESISSKILYFPTYRRIESQLEGLQKFRNRHEYYDSPFYESENDDEDDDEQSEIDDVIQFGMEDVRKRIKNITQEITHKSLIGFSKVTGDLLSQLSKEFPNYKAKATIDKRKLEIILDRVGNTISKDDKLNIVEYIKSGKKTNKGLLFLIDKLIDLYNEQEELDLAIRNFAETCNQYLNLKNFYYNESSVKLEIIRDNSEDSENRIIDLNHLSSGEKQIVSLFSKIYLDLDKSYIVLFDEPELSLSINWQQKLLPDIINSKKCNFLFCVTHSPFIYDNEVEKYAFGLTDYIKTKK